MKNAFLFASFVVIFSTSAQISINERIRFKDTVKVNKYKPDADGFSILKLKMNPGESTVLNPEELRKLKTQTIIGVDLVYSDFPKGADLSGLNRDRIIELYKFLPMAFNNNIVEWRLIKQLDVKSEADMQRYFHGFVIYYRKMPTFQQENKNIMDVVKGKAKPGDSTLLKVFERNKTWKEMLVVCDVTGSMSPYTGQLLLWIAANNKLKTFKQVVFFNDDDNKSTNQVETQDIKGIWATNTTKLDNLLDVAFEAMEKGGHEENDLEAICYAIKKYPENKQNVVLIADNWENPCDMQLLEFLKKEKIPVRVVVCGVSERMNLNLLEIAYQTGGSIHTMEQDLTDIAKVGEGKTFSIGNLNFKMSGGKFVQLASTNGGK